MMSDPSQSVLVSQKNRLWLVELTLYSDLPQGGRPEVTTGQLAGWASELV